MEGETSGIQMDRAALSSVRSDVNTAMLDMPPWIRDDKHKVIDYRGIARFS